MSAAKSIKIDDAFQNCLNVYYYPYVDFEGIEDYLEGTMAYCMEGRRAIFIGYAMIALLTVLAAAMFYLTYILNRLVSKQDRLLPFIFGFMGASLTIYVLYYSNQIIVEYRIDWFMSGLRSLNCSTFYTSSTASMLLLVGVILNL